MPKDVKLISKGFKKMPYLSNFILLVHSILRSYNEDKECQPIIMWEKSHFLIFKATQKTQLF